MIKSICALISHPSFYNSLITSSSKYCSPSFCSAPLKALCRLVSSIWRTVSSCLSSNPKPSDDKPLSHPPQAASGSGSTTAMTCFASSSHGNDELPMHSLSWKFRIGGKDTVLDPLTEADLLTKIEADPAYNGSLLIRHVKQVLADRLNDGTSWKDLRVCILSQDQEDLPNDLVISDTLKKFVLQSNNMIEVVIPKKPLSNPGLKITLEHFRSTHPKGIIVLRLVPQGLYYLIDSITAKKTMNEDPSCNGIFLVRHIKQIFVKQLKNGKTADKIRVISENTPLDDSAEALPIAKTAIRVVID